MYMCVCGSDSWTSRIATKAREAVYASRGGFCPQLSPHDYDEPGGRAKRGIFEKLDFFCSSRASV